LCLTAFSLCSDPVIISSMSVRYFCTTCKFLHLFIFCSYLLSCLLFFSFAPLWCCSPVLFLCFSRIRYFEFCLRFALVILFFFYCLFFFSIHLFFCYNFSKYFLNLYLILLHIYWNLCSFPYLFIFNQITSIFLIFLFQ
jgi:hypothetical protein